MPETRDLRHYSRQTTARLVIGGVILVFVVGDGLIYLVYGQRAAIAGLICIGAGLLPLFLTLVFFRVSDWLLRRYHES